MKLLVRPLSKLLILAGILLSSLSFSCKNSQDTDLKPSSGNLLVSSEEYNKIMNARDKQPGQTFTIENISRNNDKLSISVKGGCNAKDFRVVWNGAVMESYPMQVPLVLQLNADDAEICPSDNHSILIDLTKIIGTHDSKDYVFHVANGSIKQDKSIYPDGSVSNTPDDLPASFSD